MYKLYPYFTNDGSIGLFSPEANDIYHSTYGALTEAYEKFIIPIDLEKYMQKNTEIKILDICFGIGYNSKSLINKIIDLLCNVAIHTNNKKDETNNASLYTNNKKFKISILAIDTDKNLAYLSPFFKSFEHNIEKQNAKSEIVCQQEKIRKLSAKRATPKFKLHEEVNVLLLKSIIDKIDDEAIAILNNKKYNQYFSQSMIRLFKYLKNDRSSYNHLRRIKPFLHNIYYKYLSKGYKRALRALRLIDFDFGLEIEDARKVLKKDFNKYNFVFLDAFTPTKCPCLWSLDFFEQLYQHLHEGGMVLTYSNSAQVRNAFLQAGFIVKKIFSESQNKFTGTIAIKPISSTKDSATLFYNSKSIHDLSEYDLGLMKTRAGIFYRDKDLSLNNEAIINEHKSEVEKSNLMSSSKFIKMFNACNSKKH